VSRLITQGLAGNQLVVQGLGGSGILSGTLALQDAPDTFAAAGVGGIVSGGLALQDRADTWALAGGGATTATISFQDAPDTFVITAGTTTVGTISLQDRADSFSMGGIGQVVPALRVTDAMLVAVSRPITRPAYLVEIDWDTFSTRLCTYGSVEWNGNTWAGGGITVNGFDDTNKPSSFTLVDPDAAYRTLVLSVGIRDRLIQVWKCDVSALATPDPVALFYGYADKADIANGKVTITVGWTNSNRARTPRERIGPAIGVNFVAPPGFTIHWGDQTIVLNAKR
jgi:hypothetical protein